MVELRPLTAVLAGVVLFSVWVERRDSRGGAAARRGSRLAADRFKPVEVALLAVVLVGFCALVFVYALKLPLRFLPV